MTEIQIGDVVMYTPTEPPVSGIWRRREKRCFLVLATDLSNGLEKAHQLYSAAADDDWFYAKPKNLTLVSAANHSPTVLALIAPKDGK